MNKEDCKDGELPLEQCYQRFDVSKVCERMCVHEIDIMQLAKRIGMSYAMAIVTLKLGICPNDKIDILASALSIDKGELII